MTDPSIARVVIFSRPEDPGDLAAVLQRQLGLNKVDAKIAAHHAPGVLPGTLAREAAEQAAEAISRTGLRSVAVPADAVPVLTAAETVHHVRCGADGLELCNLTGEVDRVWPWKDLQLVSAGRVPLGHQRHYVTDNLARSNPVPADAYLKGGAVHGLEAWLLFGDPDRILRFDSEQMNFEYLGERRTGSGATNFESLIADIAVAAPGAFLTPATRKFLTRGPILEYDFKDSAMLQEQTVVQFLLSRQMHGPS